MLGHSDIWRAIDALAHERGLSASGLARKAGLDPTTFNKSKRRTPDGRLRWPSTESLAKVLTAVGASFTEFVGLIESEAPAARYQSVPLIGFAQAGSRGFFDDAGYPAGGGWDQLNFPEVPDPHAYALEITGDSMEPVYRDGDLIVVSPQASIRRGDRVVLKTRQGEVMAKLLRRQTAQKYELASLNPEYEDRVVRFEDIEWIARILWASQ